MVAELSPALWLLAMTMAAVVAARLSVARHRVALNRALHELRRPMQALALAREAGMRRDTPAAPGSLDLALAALADLDGAINGSPRPLERRAVLARAAVSVAVERWRGRAARAQRSLSLEWRAGRAYVLADPTRLAQALDNLLANAVEHGGVAIRVVATVGAEGLRIVVRDGGAAPRIPRERGPRHGHGLAVVRRIARAHGGTFELGADPAGTFASLRLPLLAAPLRPHGFEPASPTAA